VKHRVRFLLPTNHTDNNSTEWRRQWEKPTTSNLQIGVLNGSIPSAVSDTRASASAIKPSDPSIPTGIQSNTSFGGAFGDITMATTINKLHRQLQEPARSEHIVPKVKDSLFSTSKCVEADCIDIYDKKEVNYYDAKTTQINISNAAVLTGWRCPKTRLWQVPLVKHPTNVNVDTLLLDHPTKCENLNSLYNVKTARATREHVRRLPGQSPAVPCPMEHINNIYELPSIEQTVRYLHAAAGHPTKHTWMKVIARGNYNS